MVAKGPGARGIQARKNQLGNGLCDTHWNSSLNLLVHP